MQEWIMKYPENRLAITFYSHMYITPYKQLSVPIFVHLPKRRFMQKKANKNRFPKSNRQFVVY